jgi:hypothetical protein
MTKFLSASFLGLALAAFFVPDVAAQLIDPTTDVPANLINATNGEGGVKRLIVTFINWALGFLGLIAVVAIIIGGYYYLLSGGDEGTAGKGRKIIIYAIIGIIIILLSFAIVNTVLTIGTGEIAQ